MKFGLLLFFGGLVGVIADDVIYMEMFSQQVEEALVTVDADKTLPELAADLGLTTLVKLVERANLTDALSGPGPLTVFGPTNAAFKMLPKPIVNILLHNSSILAMVLEYHVLPGNFLSTNLSNDLLLKSVQGKDVRINVYKDGKVITASGRPVTLADQKASNGVLHEVRGVLLPPAGTIAYVLANAPFFKTLNTAVKAAGLGAKLSSTGPLTLFAPSDRAFARIPAKCLDRLMKNTTLLTKVLTYHVVASTAYSAGLSCGDEITTLEGSKLKITRMGKLRVNYAKVIFADGTTTNGVIHVINRVLIPPDLKSNDVCSKSDVDFDDVIDDENDIEMEENLFW